MWTQRDQFSNKQLPFIDDHLSCPPKKQHLSNQPHMQPSGSFSSRTVSSQSQLYSSSYRDKVLQSSARLGWLHTNPPSNDTDDEDESDTTLYSLCPTSLMQSLPQSISYLTVLCVIHHHPLPYRKYHARASIAYHCAIKTLLWRKQSHQRNLLFLTNKDLRVSDSYNTWTITFPGRIKFKEGLDGVNWQLKNGQNLNW